MSYRSPLTFAAVGLLACAPGTVSTPVDAHSLARPDQVRVQHVSLDLNLDFEGQRVHGRATLGLERIDTGAPLILDTHELLIEAVRGADALYTDVWASMGQEEEREQRMRDLAAYQVNGALMAEAPEQAIFMHCMPAHRGQEVTAEVIDGPQSVIFQQAANRMHVQKGVLAWLLGSSL